MKHLLRSVIVLCLIGGIHAMDAMQLSACDRLAPDMPSLTNVALTRYNANSAAVMGRDEGSMTCEEGPLSVFIPARIAQNIIPYGVEHITARSVISVSGLSLAMTRRLQRNYHDPARSDEVGFRDFYTASDCYLVRFYEEDGSFCEERYRPSEGLDIPANDAVCNEDLLIMLPSWVNAVHMMALRPIISSFKNESLAMKCSRLLGLKNTRVSLLAKALHTQLNVLKTGDQQAAVIVKDQRRVVRPVLARSVLGTGLAALAALLLRR